MTSPSWTRLRILGALCLVLALGFVACFRRAPAIRGRVLDGRTGNPIAGARVARQLYREPPIDLVDTRAEAGVSGGWAESTTRPDGSFVLPGAFVWRLSRLDWLAFKPGMMPGRGSYRRKGWGIQFAPGAHTSPPYDAWVKATIEPHWWRLNLEVRLWPPTTEGITWPFGREWTEYNPATGQHDLVRHFPDDVDPWAEYFERLDRLARGHWLPVEDLVEQAVVYTQSAWVTERTFSTIAAAADNLYLGSNVDGVPCYKADLAWTLVELQESVCRTHPSWQACDSTSLAYRMQFLEEQCSSFRR